MAQTENHCQIANAMTPIRTEEEFFSRNVPKVVFDQKGRLLYMSRAGIPLGKDGLFVSAYKQVCIYGFSREVLIKLGNSNSKTKFEEIEDIEILRFLELGYEVQMVPVEGGSIAVDTEEDLKRVVRIFREKKKELRSREGTPPDSIA